MKLQISYTKKKMNYFLKNEVTKRAAYRKKNKNFNLFASACLKGGGCFLYWKVSKSLKKRQIIGLR